MKKIGVLGGLGPEATADYYKEIIKQVSGLQGTGSPDYPEVIIYSVNMTKFLNMLEKGDYPGATSYLSENISKLGVAGAEVVIISSNTPHLLFEDICKQVRVPLISIVETCRAKAKLLGLKCCGLIGTKFTMNASFYPEVFTRDKIKVIAPDAPDILRINELLFTELELGIIREVTKTEILGIVQGMIEKKKIDSLILGCTEFPLMFREEEYLGIPFLNTTRIHVEETVKQCMKS